MANVSAIKLPNNTTYTIKDNNALPLTGGSVTGPVTFGDSVSIDEATISGLVVNGSASFTNNISANTINGVTVGNTPKFTDTTYSSLVAASGGTAVSLVTTGEKYIWNSKTSNTGTVTSVGISNGSGLTISGSPITSSGTITIGHSNSVTAQTTQAIYPIKIDAQGHISAYGSAVTSMPASDVYAWAKASTKPSYTASEVGAVPTSRTVNGKALSANITLTASDVDAMNISTSGADALVGASIWSNTNNRIAISVTTASTNGNGEDVNYRAYFKDDSIGLYNNTTSSWILRIYEPKDYIIAQSTGSTVGTWYYRCWASGATEAWGKFQETTGCTNSDAGGYRSTGITPTNFPKANINGTSTNIFSAVPVVTASAIGVGANICWPVQQSNVTATAVGKWALFRNASNASAKGYISFHVTGKWS